jgi:hypothetical protein
MAAAHFALLDHILGYFVFTLLYVSPGPGLLSWGPVPIVFAMALEALQGLTPDAQAAAEKTTIALAGPRRTRVGDR